MTSTELESVLAYVREQVKKADVRLGNDPNHKVKKLAFDIPALDHILGGGLPLGRVVLIKGDFSSGKTLLCQKAFAAAQKQGMKCAYIDVERTFEPEWFATTGVDTSQLIVAKPDYGEQAWDMAIAFVKAGVELVVLDSIAALVPTSEAEEDMEHSNIAALARLVNRGLRKIIRENHGQSVFVVLNQPRSGIGAAPFPTEALPAGKGQWMFSSIILDIRKGPWIKEGETKRIGMTIRVRTEKNKLAPPQQACELPFIFEGGVIDTERGLFDMALDAGIVKQRGSLYLCDLFPEGKVRGKLGVLDFLKKSPDVVETLRGRLGGSSTNTDEGASETSEVP